MTVLQCFWFSAWPSVTLGLTLVLSLILLNLGNFVFDGVETKCWNVFPLAYCTKQHAEYLVLCMLHVSHYCTPNSNQRLQWLFSGTYCTLYFIDTLYFRSAAIQSTIIWAWCLHLDNLTNLTNTSWSKLFSFIFLSFMLLLQTIHWWSSVLFSFAFFMQTLLTAISMSAIATNGVVPGT